MRLISFPALCLFLSPSIVFAQIAPHTATTETMDDPAENWFISTSGDGAYIYDGMTGEMQGMISVSPSTRVVQPNPARKEFYAADMYYSRGRRGERIDLLTIFDYENLSAVAEVEIPKKKAGGGFRNYIQLLGGGRHVAVFNMTPAASVTIVDVIDRRFVTEISTPGCALIMAVDENDFLMICGDGTVQLVKVDDNGEESGRIRSDEFFSVAVDPVFDRPVPYAGGWLLVSHLGQVYHVTVDGDDIEIGDAWSMLAEEDVEKEWRPGGSQMQSVHEGTGLLYVLMHQGGEYTHHEPGTEVWVYNVGAQRRIARMPLEVAASKIMVTQETMPKLIVADEEGGLHLFDALKLTHDRTIDDPGPSPSLIQDL